MHVLNRVDGWQERLRDVTVTLLDRDRRVVLASPVLNPNGVQAHPAQLDWVASAALGEVEGAERGQLGPRARFVRVSRSGGRHRTHEDPADGNVLSLVRVEVLCAGGVPRPVPGVDIARIGRVETGRRRARSRNRRRLDGNGAGQDQEASEGSEGSEGGREESPEGNLVVFLQDRFWRNGFQHLCVDRRPRVHGELATRLQYSLLDFIKATRNHSN